MTVEQMLTDLAAFGLVILPAEDGDGVVAVSNAWLTGSGVRHYGADAGEAVESLWGRIYHLYRPGGHLGL